VRKRRVFKAKADRAFQIGFVRGVDAHQGWIDDGRPAIDLADRMIPQRLSEYRRGFDAGQRLRHDAMAI
jgi:hypothetical protein